jgi:hypothetical protein
MGTETQLLSLPVACVLCKSFQGISDGQLAESLSVGLSRVICISIRAAGNVNRRSGDDIEHHSVVSTAGWRR